MMTSCTSPQATTVTPDLIRGEAFLCDVSSARGVAEGSWTPIKSGVTKHMGEG